MATYIRDLSQEASDLRQKLKETESNHNKLQADLVTSLSQNRCLKKAHTRLSGMLRSGLHWQDETCQTLESVVLDQAMGMEALKRRLVEFESGNTQTKLTDSGALPTFGHSAMQAVIRGNSAIDEQHYSSVIRSVGGGTQEQPLTTNCVEERNQSKDQKCLEKNQSKDQKCLLRDTTIAASIISKHRNNKGELCRDNLTEVENAAKAAAKMMDEIISACDREVQKLQRLLLLQGEKAQWTAIVQQQLSNQLKQKEVECENIRQELAQQNEKIRQELAQQKIGNQRQLQMIKSDRNQLGAILKQLQKHIDTIPRFRPLLLKLGVAQKVAALEAELSELSSGPTILAFPAKDTATRAVDAPSARRVQKNGTPYMPGATSGSGQRGGQCNSGAERRAASLGKDKDDLGPRFDLPLTLQAATHAHASLSYSSPITSRSQPQLSVSMQDRGLVARNDCLGGTSVLAPPRAAWMNGDRDYNKSRQCAESYMTDASRNLPNSSSPGRVMSQLSLSELPNKEEMLLTTDDLQLEPPAALLEEWGMAVEIRSLKETNSNLLAHTTPGALSKTKGSEQTEQTEDTKHLAQGEHKFLQSLSMCDYDDKMVQLGQEIKVHKETLDRERALATSHVEELNTQLEQEKLVFDRLVQAYEQVRADKRELAAQVMAFQRQAAPSQDSSSHVLLSPQALKQLGVKGLAKSSGLVTSETSTKAVLPKAGVADCEQAKKCVKGNAYTMRKMLSALGNKHSILFSLLSIDEQRCLLAGKDRHLSPNCNIIKRRKHDMVCKQGDMASSVLLVIDGELEMWVSHVRGQGGDVHGEVRKVLTRRILTLAPGCTIGDIDFILRRPHLASVIVSSDTCSLVEISQFALKELLDRRKDLVKQVTRQSLLQEAPMLDGLPFPGQSDIISQHAALLTDFDSAGEVAALCEMGIFT